MPTLFNALLSQHARTLKPVRYTEPMTTQLQSFFEEVVLENSLEALVVESLPLRAARKMREVERVRRIGKTARYPFFLTSPKDEITYWLKKGATADAESNLIMLPRLAESPPHESFLVIADTHFSALLCAVNANTENECAEHQVIYTFDPDVVYTALEYLKARFAVEHPAHAELFHEAIHRSMPKATWLHLTLSVTTKLANLWQEQTGREIAVNRIATAIRQSLELDEILQTVVNEVGAAIGEKRCALLVEPEADEQSPVVYLRGELSEDDSATISSDLEAFRKRLLNNPQPHVRDGCGSVSADGWSENPQIVVPMSFLNQFVGVLLVQADQTTRVWQESELLLLQTVADQAAIAIKHARLYVKSQQEALRDGLTGVFNRRFFETQFEREFKLHERKNASFGVVMIDIDKFKNVNDTHGHLVGDQVLKSTANLLRGSLRSFDTLARYGGEEFIVILPHVTLAEAEQLGRHLRRAIENAQTPELPQITASLGVAVYPNHGKTMPELLRAADDALYLAKRSGRNRVCLWHETDETEDGEMTGEIPIEKPDAKTDEKPDAKFVKNSTIVMTF